MYLYWNSCFFVSLWLTYQGGVEYYTLPTSYLALSTFKSNVRQLCIGYWHCSLSYHGCQSAAVNTLHLNAYSVLRHLLTTVLFLICRQCVLFVPNYLVLWTMLVYISKIDLLLRFMRSYSELRWLRFMRSKRLPVVIPPREEVLEFSSIRKAKVKIVHVCNGTVAESLYWSRNNS